MGGDVRLGLPDGLAILINLTSASDRRAFQEQQLNRLSIPFVVLPATTAADIVPSELSRFRNAWARPLRATEIACTLSHRRAWAEVVAGGRPRLILEDDAVLSPSLPALLAELIDRPATEYVTLETYVHPKLLSRKKEPLGAEGFAISRLYRDRGGAAAYLLWPDGARRLLAATKTVLPLADAAIDLAPGLVRHQIEPAAARQAQFLPAPAVPFDRMGTSIIFTEPMPGRGSGVAWLRFRLRRLRMSLGLLLRRLRASDAVLRQVHPAADIGWPRD
ncbi:glycosyltransferase family 25 protein [Frigidibacter sp. RF13]|uniref:glycosyltransferase family 25 protein n=1 Tax=Frigidibacter sp. RF13 TaxID=2997340 RepID=UPI00226E28D8|nr:glycosyltransferase family 25 protein [Frigidibacter sp. RF13]MCY1126048.1 glycosyltransferase family 25 protein [Frigidibacter sp. RF13]